MKRIAALFLLVLLVAACVTPLSAVQRAHQSTLMLRMSDGFCSGTAIGPHAILSATHCFGGSPSIVIDGKPVVITGSISDGHDHTILFVDRLFDAYASIGRAPLQGDPVFILGNPGGMPDLYRAGHVAGNAPGVVNGATLTLYDMQDFPGDSGSGIFDADGQLVGVISSFFGMDDEENGARLQFAGSFSLAFTPQQLAQVQRIDPAHASP